MNAAIANAPAGLVVDDSSDGLTISWRWGNRKRLVVLCLLAVAPLVAMAVTVDFSAHELGTYVAAAIWVLISAMLVYFGLMAMLNSTRIRVDGAGTLTVTSGPLPGGLNARFEGHEIVGFDQQRSSFRGGVGYRLRVVTRSGRKPIIFGADDPARTEWMGQVLAGRLGLAAASMTRSQI
jgi:hypothetical protein